jgi:hypothetical protein
MLAAAELSTKAKIAVFFISVALRRYNAQEQRDTKIYEKQEEEEEKKACKYRKEIWFVPATGIVEWIVMVVTFPVVVV